MDIRIFLTRSLYTHSVDRQKSHGANVVFAVFSHSLSQPENLLFAEPEKKTLKLIDFGLAYVAWFFVRVLVTATAVLFIVVFIFVVVVVGVAAVVVVFVVVAVVGQTK